ncbi:MAG: hypothetical protein ACERKK_01875 [Poseidonibacter sp.]|uniref:hypothetical protein n=1 Tax=Poseidonibacter sp. TaxID=2321188 RepID=UPI00359E2651
MRVNMHVNKQIVIILILASLLLSAVGAAFYFFKKNKETLKSKNELITIFIAKEDLKRNTLIELKHLTKTQVAKQFILNKPLLKNEILGKYTKEVIYKNEIFLKQKLNTKIEKNRAKILDFKHSSYNMQFALFHNPDYSLVQGDLINIISVIPTGTIIKGKVYDYAVEYAANNLKILGFLRDGRPESETITKQKIRRIVNKKEVEQVVDVKSDQLILDVQPDVLLRLIKDYNKGNQLWMVKTRESAQIEPSDQASVKKDVIEKVKDGKVEVIKNTADDVKTKTIDKIVKVIKPKVYTYKWYEAKARTISRSAVIEYSKNGASKDNKNAKRKDVNITLEPNNLCSEIKDKLIVGSSNNFYARSQADKKSKYKRILHKNTIIPYVEVVGQWYKTCDNNFIHTSVVKKISYEEAKKRLAKK